MPSGPESFVSQPNYATEITRARALLLAHPGRWRVIYHYDGDGIASASALVRALQRLGYPFQATALLAVERGKIQDLLQSTHGPVLVVDTGASWLDLFAAHAHPVIILDHHKFPGSSASPDLPAHVAFVNPLDWGVDGMGELCASTLSWLYTVFLDPKNWDNAPWGLSGAIADRQHQGGFHGLNSRLVNEAAERGFLVARPGVPLFGTTVEDSLVHGIDPYVVGLSSRPDSVRTFLATLGLDPRRGPSSLTPEEEKQLADAVEERLKAQGTRSEFLSVLRAPRWWIPSLDLDAEELSNRQNASGRMSEPGVGVAIALGDRTAMERARTLEVGWRDGILRGLRRLEDEGVNSGNAIQWFESPETSLAGTQAGLAMNYLLDPNKPVFVSSNGSPSLKISSRGTNYLVNRGLDLSTVCRTAAAAVGGEGGGHRVASGATIPRSTWPAFLTEADRLVAEQLGGRR